MEQDKNKEIPESPEKKAKEVYDIFSFSEKISGAYRELRYKDTPPMREANLKGDTESIAEHMWDVEVTWHNLQAACPNLAAVVDNQKIGNMLRMHDIGEIEAGDISRDAQLDGVGADKGHLEREGIIKLVADLPRGLQKEYIDLYDEYENGETVEAKIAHIVDSMCGTSHLFDKAVLDDESYFERQRRMNKKHLTPQVSSLLNQLESAEQQDAYDDLMNMLDGFCKYITSKGMKLDPLELIEGRDVS